MELYIQKQKILEIGTATDAKDYYITDSTKTWTTNQYENYYVYILSGTGAGLIIKITSNDATTLYFASISKDLEDDVSYEIVYFPYERVEMFQDEKVSVTSTIQNYSDIGKLFTDYSQSFTIPASAINNSIFSHWYDNAVDNGYDARIRYNAYIEIDTIPFREGNVQLEKANKKNGYIESYTLTFYGNLTQLKDKFGEDKLNSLDYSSLNHSLTSTEVFNRVSTNTYNDLFYPLIGNNRKFEYLTTTSSDVTTNTGAIKWNDLFPAVSLTNIFNFIQNKYNITFTGNFLNYQQFNKLYMYMKNMELPRAYNTGLILDNIREATVGYGAIFDEASISQNTVTSNWANTYWTGLVSDPLGTSNRRLKMGIQIQTNPTFSSVLYQIKIYQDGILYKAFSDLTGNQDITFYDQTRNNDPDNHVYYVEIASQGTFTFVGTFSYTRIGNLGNRLSQFYNFAFTPPLGSQTILSTQNVSSYVPDIKVADFFMGIVKMFNLIITPIDATTFKLEPLELYYQSGQIKDLTQYIYSDELDIEKPKLFKVIDFSYEKSENILNNKFSGLFNREYGDLIYNSTANLESGKYEIKLPFEDVMWEKTTGYNFQTATLLNKDLQSYTPKPILMYKNDLTTVPTAIKLTTSTTGYHSTTNYIRFTNDIPLGASDLAYVNTINWGAEVSSWFLTVAPDGLYKRHYEQYIANLYNQKTRVLKVKAKLPSKLLGQAISNNPNELVNLKLNDRIIIRDNRYIINSFTTDLTNGETTLELINDYRVLGYNSVGYRFSNIEMLRVDNTAQEFQLDLYLGLFKEFTITSVTGWITSPTSGKKYDDTSMIISIDANTTGLQRIDNVTIKFKDFDDVETIVEIPITQEP